MAQEKATRTSKQAVFGQEEIAALIDKFLSIERIGNINVLSRVDILADCVDWTC